MRAFVSFVLCVCVVSFAGCVAGVEEAEPEAEVEAEGVEPTSYDGKWVCVAVHRYCEGDWTPGHFHDCDSHYYVGSGKYRWEARHAALDHCEDAHSYGCSIVKCVHDSY